MILVCSVCNIEKPEDEFYPEKESQKNSRGFRWSCKDCSKEATITSRQRAIKNNPIKQRAYDMRNGAKQRAKQKNIDFDLTPDFVYDLCQRTTNCPALGMRLTYGAKGRCCASSASLDRIDNRLGYVKGNVQILSHRANSMKNNASDDMLLTVAKNYLSGVKVGIAKRDGSHFCTMTGLEIDFLSTEKRDQSPSIDKIHPALGYMRGNAIQQNGFCSFCNSFCNSTPNQF